MGRVVARNVRARSPTQERAIPTCRRHRAVTGDIDLEVMALAYAGASLVHEGHVEDGMTMLDEAMAAVAGGEIDDFFLFEEIFCQLFSACEYARDVVRADQWISIGDSIAARACTCRPCRRSVATHYAGVLTAAGRWTEAANSLSAAIEAWDLSRRSQLRTGALGEACRPSCAARPSRGSATAAGDDRVVQLWWRLPIRCRDPFHPRRAGQATSVLEAALIDTDRSQTSAVPLLELLVEVNLAAHRTDAAPSAAAVQLSAIADCNDSDYVRAVAALCVCPGVQGVGRLRSATTPACALAAFSRAWMPFEIAVARLELQHGAR